jgi:hypothetical protein
MQRDRVQKGILIKLKTDYSNVPAGTWGTVDATGSMNDDTWWFRVKWHHYRPIPTKFPREVIEYSLNLWEADLAIFEVLTIEDEQAARKPHPNYQGSLRARMQQLSLPFNDD